MKPILIRLKHALEAMPPRSKTIHKSPCKHCPTVVDARNGISDPECEDIKRLSRAEQLETVFACGWRQDKLCKGYCDSLGITEEDLA